MTRANDAAQRDVLPESYRVLPASVEFRVPGFHAQYRPGDRVLVPAARDCDEWFNTFVARVLAAVGRQYLPVCRMSDGEFQFMLGDQPPDVRAPRMARLVRTLRRMVGNALRRGRFRAATAPGVSSGRFSAGEWAAARARYAELVRDLAERGVLALHLSYCTHSWFQEHYFPAFGAWLEANRIEITDRNYVPFYFVYALLTGPRRRELLTGRRVLCVHGARSEKRARIEASLRREGVAEVHWCEISADRSFFDRPQVDGFAGRVDLVLVGAGVGKPGILQQLAPLGVPALDAGFVFEVWADPDKRWDRPFCVPDEEWDERRARFIPPHVAAAQRGPA